MDVIILKEIIHIGFPAGIQAVMYGISNVVIQVGVNGLGTDYVAAWATYYKIDGIFWMTVSAFGICAATFVGQNYGADRYDRVRKSVVVSLLQAMIASVFISVVVYLLCPWIFPIFTTDPTVKQIGIAMMRFLTPVYITYVSIEILSGALRGVGDTFVPMLISVVGICFLRSAWILLVMPHYNNMYTMMLSYPITWTITSVVFWIYTFGFSGLKKYREIQG